MFRVDSYQAVFRILLVSVGVSVGLLASGAVAQTEPAQTQTAQTQPAQDQPRASFGRPRRDYPPAEHQNG